MADVSDDFWAVLIPKITGKFYTNDAYNSLAIEGFGVTPELIERIRAGAF
jgi:hypothetical protein